MVHKYFILNRFIIFSIKLKIYFFIILYKFLFKKQMENFQNKKEIIKFINTDCSPSHLSNNINISKSNIAYIHNSESTPRIILINKK